MSIPLVFTSTLGRRTWIAYDIAPAQRAAIVQRYYLGMSEAEMSEDAGRPPGTIKSRLYAARRGLLRLLRSQARGRATTRVGPSTYPSKEERL
jgi:hypothetical protein